AFVEARRRAAGIQIVVEDADVTQALRQLREAAHRAFMNYPEATEVDFERCWPTIRQELLTHHALNELATDRGLKAAASQQLTDANLTTEMSDEGALTSKIVH